MSLPPYSAFNGNAHIASGTLADVGLALKRAIGADGRPLIFANATGRVVDLHLHGSDDELVRHAKALSPATNATQDDPLEADSTPSDVPRGRGRPKLGVVAREVTLLPRHWEWLAGEPGGASVALRKLVEAARRSPEGLKRRARERAYQFVSALLGNEPGFEEAARALFADDLPRLQQITAHWPPDVRAHMLKLAMDEGGPTSPK